MHKVTVPRWIYLTVQPDPFYDRSPDESQLLLQMVLFTLAAIDHHREVVYAPLKCLLSPWVAIT